MAERTAVLTPLAFPLSASSFRGVLEATQEDMRAGVFTMDLLFLLSCVASVKLQTNKSMGYVGNTSHKKPCRKERVDSPHVDSADGKDGRPECCVLLPCRLWRGFRGRQHCVSAFLLSCSPVGLGWADQGGTSCSLQRTTQTGYHFYSNPKLEDAVFYLDMLSFYF